MTCRTGRRAIAEPRTAHRVEPVFPAGRRGSVILEITIARDGPVEDVRTLRADDGFEAPAVAAIRQWRYEPTIVDGRPIRVIHTVALVGRYGFPIDQQPERPAVASGSADRFGGPRSASAESSAPSTAKHSATVRRSPSSRVRIASTR